jgi:GT2 family glycosyltransferase
MALDVSVVIPINSRFDVFAHCLEALAEQTYPADRYEVLAVANGVEGAALDELRALIGAFEPRYGGRLRLVEVDRASIALARNAGIGAARGAVILQINEDAVLSPTALAQHWAGHEEFGFDPHCVLLGGREFTAALRRRLFNYLYEAAGLYTPLHWRRPRFAGNYQWFVTCNLSCTAEAYDRFGCYDPAYVWGSDTALGCRWQQAGVMRLFVDTSIRAYHLHELSFAGHRGNCLKRAPFQFRQATGRLPHEVTEDERTRLRSVIEASRAEIAAFEADLQRLEAEFAGPEAFAGASVMGIPTRTLREFDYVTASLLQNYRFYLYCSEVLRLSEPAEGASAREQQRQVG